MACINMFSPEHHQGGVPMSPRISFSNDFVVSEPSKHDRAAAAAPPDPNFEFTSGGNAAPYRPMMAADELFFKGRLVPLRETPTRVPGATTTLRDELLRGGHDCEEDEVARKGSSIRWKGLLGLRRGHCSAKKQEMKVVEEEEGVVVVHGHGGGGHAYKVASSTQVGDEHPTAMFARIIPRIPLCGLSPPQ